MKIRIITALALLSGLLMGSCSREDVPGGGQPGTGNRVEFTLAGITPKHATRATGDNDTAQQIVPATDEEKSVASLLAVAYEKQESGEIGYYQTFDVSVSDAGCSFDIAKEGRFDLYLVANADGDLEAAIRGLGAGSAVTELEELIATQAPDAAGAFLMTTPEALKIISYSGEVANCGEVSLRRLSARVDIYNKADGLTITKVTFRNRAIKSQLITPNAMISGDDVVEDKEYEMNLEGNFTTPTKYEAQIYTYENLSTRGSATVPSLNIEYTYNGETYEHEVQFLDANDPEELTPLALKRNYLYRITVGRKLEPEFNLEVLDWVNEDAFNVDDIPFQTQMNAKLAINNFATSNVATLNEGEGGQAGTITFVKSDPINNSGLFAWSDKWATSYYFDAESNTYYRVPTKDEAYLLLPDVSLNINFTEIMSGDSEIEETLPDYLFGSKEVNGGVGKSVFKNAASVSPTPVGTRAGGPLYPIIYAIRFKGTAQCAAYRYENKNAGDTSTSELEVRIKALQPNTLMTIDEVADEAYWGNPADGDTDAVNQLIWHIPATGYKESEGNDVVSKGYNSFMWSSTIVDESNSVDFGHALSSMQVTSYAKTGCGALLMVKTTPEAQQEKLNAALKVNMFTQYNAKEFDLRGRTITSFYDKLTVSLADCPTTSYVSYTQLQADHATDTDAIFTGPEGKKYRLPTAGELALLMPMWTEIEDRPTVDNEHDGLYHPWWNDNASTNTLPAFTVETPFTETIYLKNDESGYADKTTMPDETDGEYVIKGESQMKVGAQTDQIHLYTEVPDVPEKGNYNIAPVYALRFKGTSQYAAYRWEYCKIATDPLERYISIKIKALAKDDQTTTIDQVAQESFWADGFLEFQFPCSGLYEQIPDASSDNNVGRGYMGRCVSSTLLLGGLDFYYLFFNISDCGIIHASLGNSFPLRFVEVKE